MRKLVASIVLALIPVSAFAIDHKNLDEGRPLRLDDAYAISTGEIAVEAGAGFTLQRRRSHRGFFPIEVLYGAFPNFQIGLGTLLSTDPREVDERPKSGDVRFNALYNFNQETLGLPAFGVKLGLEAPTGIDSRGFAVELKGIVTKSFERLSIHFNGGYEFFTDSRREERDGQYSLVLGASYPVGAPKFTRATLIADVFSEQSVHRGEPNVVGTELGLRYQLTPRIVWDVGVGTEFAGPGDRSRLFGVTGFSFGF
jgi:outer membrane putative beta-barrel porin/alpha-amylase